MKIRELKEFLSNFPDLSEICLPSGDSIQTGWMDYKRRVFLDKLDADTGPITSFTGPYFYLSNFYPVPVRYDGIWYPSSENAYQAAKTDSKNRMPFLTCTASESKKLGRAVQLRAGWTQKDWDSHKLEVMEEILLNKFQEGSFLADKLLETGMRELVEGNTWGDTYYGVCGGKGHNHLGKLLMKIRTEMQARQESRDWASEGVREP